MGKMRYYISGGFGFIGRNLAEELKKTKDGFTLLWQENLKRPILTRNDFDVIYHLAANTDTRFPDDVEMFRNNILSFLNVLDFALKGKSKLIYASSGSVVGEYEKTAYAESKRVIDEIAKHFFDKLPIVGLRFQNVFGPYEHKKGNMASMITQWANQIKEGKRPAAFLEERNTKRDHIYVKDVVKALKMAEGLQNGIYDVGSGVSTSFDDVLNLVQKALGSNLEPIYVENPYKGRYQKDTKANLDWGFKPDYSLEEGIKDYLQNYETSEKSLGQ